MRLYVEANFVLEISLAQEEQHAAERLLKAAESGHVQLFMPTLAIGETLWRLEARRRERRTLTEGLLREASQLSRSSLRGRTVRYLSEGSKLLTQTQEGEAGRLESTVSRVLKTGQLLTTDHSSFQAAQEYRTRYDLSLTDAMILATVTSSLNGGGEPSDALFVNRDKAAFGAKEITGELAAFGCKYLPSFRQATQFIFREGQP